jgi:hypothetical protein
MPEKKTDEKKTKPFKPAMRELRLGAVADRLNLPEHAGYTYWAMVNVLSAATAGVHTDRIVDWLETQATTNLPTVEGPIVAWTRAVLPLIPDLVADAVRVLAVEGLVTTEARMFQTAKGEVFERTKVTLLPVEEWENDKHFLAALALRFDS